VIKNAKTQGGGEGTRGSHMGGGGPGGEDPERSQNHKTQDGFPVRQNIYSHCEFGWWGSRDRVGRGGKKGGGQKNKEEWNRKNLL